MMQERKKKVLVTGGAGFIGSHLIEALLRTGRYDVTSLDNYFTGSEKNHIPGATYIKGDTKDIDALITVPPDLIFHLGEYSRVEKSFDDLPLVWRSNKEGTFAVLEFSRKHGAKLVYAGSSTKFGDGGLGRDQSPYAWTKASNTELVQNFGAWYGLSYAITYFYNVYGGREIAEGPYATLIGIFKRLHQEGKPLPVVSPGTQQRIFTHVDDIVAGLILVGEKGEGDGYGLGADETHTVLEIAEMFGGDITMLPPRKGNRMSAQIDLARSKNELGWSAKKRIAEDIAEHVQKAKK